MCLVIFCHLTEMGPKSRTYVLVVMVTQLVTHFLFLYFAVHLWTISPLLPPPFKKYMMVSISFMVFTVQKILFKEWCSHFILKCQYLERGWKLHFFFFFGHNWKLRWTVVSFIYQMWKGDLVFQLYFSLKTTSLKAGGSVGLKFKGDVCIGLSWSSWQGGRGESPQLLTQRRWGDSPLIMNAQGRG